MNDNFGANCLTIDRYLMQYYFLWDKFIIGTNQEQYFFSIHIMLQDILGYGKILFFYTIYQKKLRCLVKYTKIGLAQKSQPLTRPLPHYSETFMIFIITFPKTPYSTFY